MTISSSSSSSSGESHHHPSAVELDIVPNLAAAAAAGAGGIGGSQSEVVFVKCDCCGLTEECTETYIAKVRERYQGRWICGLCAEAVKDEIFRSAYHQHQSQTSITTTTTTTTTESGTISTEEALNRHMNFCNKFKSSHPPPNPTKHLISAMKQLLRRSSSLTTTTTIRSTPPTSPHPPRPRPNMEMITEPRRRLSRSESCFTTLAS